jgi:isopentenyl diphosphate isomerase/L-lactate dehydrogenase-like FMN-dependent dehydrogenase
MTSMPPTLDHLLRARRRLLKLLAASPLALAPAWAGQLPTSAQEALDVFDLEALARQALPIGHFGYLATGTDDERTLAANREAFGRYQLRVRRLVDVAALDLTTTLFGVPLASPIVLAPVGSQRAFHPDGELATARAARERRALQIYSSVASTAVEEVNDAREEPVWYQLYPTNDWTVGRAVATRAEKAGCPVLVLTVDNTGNNRLTEARAARQDTRPCQACHPIQGPRYFIRRPMYAGLDLSAASRLSPHDWTWDYVKRLKDHTRMRLVLKGIVTREDAEQAIEHGADGIIVSNHGGRAEDSGRGAVESVAEVVAGAAGRVPVIVDSGFRRGTDIFKALALGAAAVAIGRPYIWGIAAFGQAGVARAHEVLTRELEMVMRQAGTRTLADIGPSSIIDRGHW